MGETAIPVGLVVLVGGISLIWSAIKGRRLRDTIAPPTPAEKTVTQPSTQAETSLLPPPVQIGLLPEDHVIPAPVGGALGLVGTNATTQKMQGGLPAATQTVWRAVVATFGARIKALGAWGDKAHMARNSCHNSGRALDIHPDTKATGDAVAAWAIAHHSAFDIRLVIWFRHKCGASTGWKWQPYHGTSPHTDHVHLSIGCDG